MNRCKWMMLLCGVCFLFPQMLAAQTIEQEMKEFEDFVKAQQKEFEDFVSEQNRQFIQYIKENWKSYKSEQTESRPKRPEPIAPVKVDKKAPLLKPEHIPIGKIQKIPEVTPSATFPELAGGDRPLQEDDNKLPEKDVLTFDFFGIACSTDLSMKNCVHLNGISEQEVAAGWEILSRKDFRAFINECLVAKGKFRLNDYGYLLYVQKASSSLLEQEDDIVLLQAFILCQSGYKVKMARIEGKLCLLYASADTIYGTTYLTINGERYYKWGARVANGTSIYTYSKNFADSKYLVSMRVKEVPAFEGDPIRARTLQSKKYPALRVTSLVSNGLVSFYNSYPQCDLSVYFNAPVCESIKYTVVSDLQNQLREKSKVEAANMLIDFVQTAFKYKTDGEQFGYEKPFFIDELFYYPYSDCEDRAFLFAYLIREILNLDVVLLDYPNHVATAVYFDTAVDGDYITLDGKKYVICDPTYIGASIGMAMPQFKSVSAKVIMR